MTGFANRESGGSNAAVPKMPQPRSAARPCVLLVLPWPTALSAASLRLAMLLVGMILGLAPIYQPTIADGWRWWTGEWRWRTVTRPYMVSQVRPYVLSVPKEHALRPGDLFRECAQDCPEMVVVPAGSFTMGGPTNDVEQPQHTVTFTKPFAVSKYEVTFADWDACVAGGGCNGYKPDDHRWGRAQQPVVNVNWDDAQAYVAWLSSVIGNTYRLLTEAEYEYATRGGTTTVYPWGDERHANGDPYLRLSQHPPIAPS
jgi:hypothetical protein